MNKLLALACGLLLATGLVAADTPPKVTTPVSPGYPAELTDTGRSGSAIVTIVVNADGTVGESTLTSADHPAFGTAAMSVVKDWKFDPATRDGTPIAKRVAIPFKFVAPTEQVLNAALHRRVYQPITAPILTVEQYGSRPVLKRMPPQDYPQSLAGTGTAGDVRVKFVVGPEGNTFNPLLLGEPRREFVVPAIAAIAHAAFEPLVKDGQGVYVEETLVLHFSEPGHEPADAGTATPTPAGPAPKSGGDGNP